jgi:hypothetical protein
MDPLVLGDNGKHDDQVDSTAQFLDWFKKPFPGQNVFELYRREAEKRETAKASLCPHQGATGDRRGPYLLRPARHDQKPTLRGYAAEPMRQLAVMLASVSRPPVPICGNVLGHGCVFI